ncbi:MAG: hypothetical protein ACXVEF_30395 [Polyangiales bacterium]
MRRDRVTPALVGVAVLCTATAANATGFTDIGNDFEAARDKTEFKIQGNFRLRGEALNNLDLDRGLTPSGQALFPIPAGTGAGQTLTYADMRLRTDLAFYAPGGLVAVKSRIDVLDNTALGGNAVGIPSASTTQASPIDAFHVKRLYGEVLLPFGLLAAGRMGNHWGLGILANGGDCGDCDSGDAQDRIAFVTPVLGHILGASYDFSWIGPTQWRVDGTRRLGFAPVAQVQTVTFAILRYSDGLAHERRRLAGKVTVNYGAYVTHRWQSGDAPYAYLPIAQGGRAGTITSRGFTATAFDGWFRVVVPHGRVEGEIAYLIGNVDNPSLIPGLTSNQPVTSHQLGAALQSDIGAPHDPIGGGLDLGYASGDSAPGFGVNPDPGSTVAAKPGELDGAQANLPYDRTVDNFKFHPDYRIDRILFREIIGTVTDAYYLRPHARADLLRLSTGVLSFDVAAVASWAVYAQSTPGGKTPLGFELDPSLVWHSRDRFSMAFEYAAFFPGSAFNNPAQHLAAKPAQLARVRLLFGF